MLYRMKKPQIHCHPATPSSLLFLHHHASSEKFSNHTAEQVPLKTWDFMLLGIFASFCFGLCFPKKCITYENKPQKELNERWRLCSSGNRSSEGLLKSESVDLLGSCASPALPLVRHLSLWDGSCWEGGNFLHTFTTCPHQHDSNNQQACACPRRELMPYGPMHRPSRH